MCPHGNPIASVSAVCLIRAIPALHGGATLIRRRLYRVYPSGGRLGFEWWISGHNLDPVHPWSVGCQLAALNMQCHDRCYRLNTGRFRLNRRAG
jgi:hypothetical protein